MTKSVGDDWVGVPVLAREMGITMRLVYKLLGGWRCSLATWTN